MKEDFEAYLVARGYKQVTPSGKPSTVYDYCRRIDFIVQEERCTWQELAEKIDDILPCYDSGGSKEGLGRLSHSAVINALKRFSEFIKSK